MSNYIFNRNRQMFIAAQTVDALTLPTSITAANFCLFSKLSLDSNTNSIVRPDLNGSRTSIIGLKGRMTGSYSAEMTLAGSGSAGVAPDNDVMLQSVFGQAPTVVATTSVTYNLTDAISTFALYHFRKDTTGSATGITQQIGMGCTTKDCTISVGQDLATIAFSGDCQHVLDTDNFANYLAAWKGGLSAMPTVPAGPLVSHGKGVIGFTGSISVDGNVLAELKSATVKLGTGNTIVSDSFGTFIGSGTEGDLRGMSISMTLDDNNGTAINDLKQKAWSFTPIDIILTAGTIPGEIWTITLKSVQLQGAKFNDGQRRVRLDFGDSTAHGTGSGLDAVTLILT